MGRSDDYLSSDSSSNKLDGVIVTSGVSSWNMWTISAGLDAQKVALLSRRHVWRQSLDALSWLHGKPPSLGRKG